MPHEVYSLPGQWQYLVVLF